jgi:multidrug efflux pump subunit AcrA (membrane-fusion protein)
VWCPLVLSDGTYVGGLWFGREKPWQENEHILIKSLCEIYAHGMAALEGPQFFKQPKQRGKVFVWSGIACILLILYFPLSLSTLAPSEIVPRDPSIVSAPINGVISEIYVSPNTYVEQGTLLFSYDDTELRNKFEVAEQAMSVSSVELRRATQGAFLDEESKSQVALLNAQLELRQAELDYASELLKQVDVYANEPGLLIYTEESDWIGKPINVGEQVMQIADPENIRVKIDVPVGDAIILKEGAEVDVFLDVDPLNSLDARVTHTSYNAEPTTGDVLAYRVYADLDDESKDVRIGLQGTAKIYGHTVNLFFYLFRRPISSLRQFIGY